MAPRHLIVILSTRNYYALRMPGIPGLSGLSGCQGWLCQQNKTKLGYSSFRLENTIQSLITIIDQINLKIRQLTADREFSFIILKVGGEDSESIPLLLCRFYLWPCHGSRVTLGQYHLTSAPHIYSTAPHLAASS